MSTTALMHPMHKRPRPGQRVIVHMKDGRALECCCTLVIVEDRRGIVIYHKRRAVDEMKAAGWWPDPR